MSFSGDFNEFELPMVERKFGVPDSLVPVSRTGDFHFYLSDTTLEEYRKDGDRFHAVLRQLAKDPAAVTREEIQDLMGYTEGLVLHMATDPELREHIATRDVKGFVDTIEDRGLVSVNYFQRPEIEPQWCTVVVACIAFLWVGVVFQAALAVDVAAGVNAGAAVNVGAAVNAWTYCNAKTSACSPREVQELEGNAFINAIQLLGGKEFVLAVSNELIDRHTPNPA